MPTAQQIFAILLTTFPFQRSIVAVEDNRLQTAEDLEQVFIAWNTDLLRFIYARVRQRATAEDLTQEVFLKAWRFRSSFDPQKASIKTWLFVIARNTVHDHFRAHKNRPTESLDETLPDSTDIGAREREKDSARSVLSQMKKLSERDQELLTLRYVQDFSIEDISDVTGLTYNAAKVALHRATERLRKLCDET